MDYNSLNTFILMINRGEGKPLILKCQLINIEEMIELGKSSPFCNLIVMIEGKILSEC